MRYTIISLFTALFFFGSSAWAQQIRTKDTRPLEKTMTESPKETVGKPKSYQQVITSKAKTQFGLFKVHGVDERYFFEIPDSLLDRDMLLVNRIAKAAADVRGRNIGYAGDEIGQQVVRFEKGPANKLFVKGVSYSERAQDTSGMYRSVLNSNFLPILASFDVKAFHTDSVTGTRNTVIDVTDYLNGDNDVFFFEGGVKKSLSLGSLQADRSYLENIKSYKTNIEIHTIKTYSQSSGLVPGAVAANKVITYALNSSIVLLPRIPMKARFADARVGYFTTGYTDFDANPQGIKYVSMITRWNLQPKKEDEEKYKRGELVEPAHPIIFYIDPATPKKWVPYLIQGINDWQEAFESAGFKNAIIGRTAPTDSTWSIDDASHNAIVYKPSATPNASGPHIHDPRSGEIIETHVNWYHNVMSLIHNWYMVQAGPLDPKAQSWKIDDELMGQLIRFVSSHEIGHTLGLRHNFGSSSTVPVKMLRDKAWLEAHGHTPSIMDYARFNYVAQPEDRLTQAEIFPKIGEYDKWAIDWGYRWRPEFPNAETEKHLLKQLIVDSLSRNPRLWFGSETDTNDPRTQSEDLGDDAVLAGTYGIKNLKRIIPNLMKWTAEPDNGYLNASTLYSEVMGQFSRYIGHVERSIGGIYTTPKSIEQPGDVYSGTTFKKQHEAIGFFNREVFQTPDWLIDPVLIRKTGYNSVSAVRDLQLKLLARLQNGALFARLIYNSEIFTGTSYGVRNLLEDLNSGIFSELRNHRQISSERKILQRSYIDNLNKILPSKALDVQLRTTGKINQDLVILDTKNIVRQHLIFLKNEIVSARKSAQLSDREYLSDLDSRLADILRSSAR